MHDAQSTVGSGVARGTDKHDCPSACTSGSVRPLASSAGLLPHGSDDSRETHSQRGIQTGSGFQRSSNGLGHGLQGGDATGSSKSESPAKERQLGLFAEIESHFVARTCQIEWRRLRACELVRLLNATPLGPIINDRQLYRHRQRAPWIHCGDHHIDLFKYTAWLSIHRRSRKPRRRRVRGREVLSLDELREILRRQDFRCALTGQQLTPTNFALDHIIPVVDGGDFTASNSQLVLKVVNRAKNTMSEPEFIEMCRQVARYRGAAPAIDKDPTPTQGVQE